MDSVLEIYFDGFRFEVLFDFAAIFAVGFFGAGFREADFFEVGFVTVPGFEVGFDPGSFALTAFTAVFAFLTVPEDTRVFPFAARFPIIVPAIAPATAPTGPAMTLPTIAPATPPAVCFETGRLLLG